MDIETLGVVLNTIEERPTFYCTMCGHTGVIKSYDYFGEVEVFCSECGNDNFTDNLKELVTKLNDRVIDLTKELEDVDKKIEAALDSAFEIILMLEPEAPIEHMVDNCLYEMCSGCQYEWNMALEEAKKICKVLK